MAQSQHATPKRAPRLMLNPTLASRWRIVEVNQQVTSSAGSRNKPPINSQDVPDGAGVVIYLSFRAPAPLYGAAGGIPAQT